MSDDRKQTSTDDKQSGDAAPHNPGLDPKPQAPGAEDKQGDAVPYEKKEEPAQQPS